MVLPRSLAKYKVIYIYNTTAHNYELSLKIWNAWKITQNIDTDVYHMDDPQGEHFKIRQYPAIVILRTGVTSILHFQHLDLQSFDDSMCKYMYNVCNVHEYVPGCLAIFFHKHMSINF